MKQRITRCINLTDEEKEILIKAGEILTEVASEIEYESIIDYTNHEFITKICDSVSSIEY